MLTPSLAQEIAAETSALIGFNVLITDSKAVVIGSGDIDRVGGFHEASVEVLRTMQLASHGSPQAYELLGVKPGITLPLVINGEAVGTVGITGAPARVKRFGLLVQRQTEILLQESATVRSGLLRERVLEDLVRDITSVDDGVVDPGFLTSRAAELGYDLNKWRIAIALEISAPPERLSGGGAPAPDTSVLRPDFLHTIRQVFSDGQDIVTTTGSGRAAILHCVSPSRGSAQAVVACRRVVQMMKARHRTTARMGLGGPANSVGSLSVSYRDASEALQIGPQVDPLKMVFVIDDLRIHQLVATVGRTARAHLSDTVLDGLRTQRDWLTLRATLIVWCENGFNLVTTSKALNVHRNTLVYRLTKIRRLAAIDPRDYRGCLTLYLACLADHMEHRPT